jgi:hypothetical protein
MQLKSVVDCLQLNNELLSLVSNQSCVGQIVFEQPGSTDALVDKDLHRAALCKRDYARSE